MPCRGDLPNGWWRDRELLVAEVDHHGSRSAAAKAHGVASSTVGAAWASFNLPTLPKSKARISTTELPAEVSEEERLRQRCAELERQVKAQREGEVLESRIVEAIRSSCQAAVPKYKSAKSSHSASAKHEMALLFSDTHASETVKAEETLGMNVYDWDVMLARMARLQDALLSHKEHQAAPVDVLHVWMLGDMLSGDIHDELAQTNDRPGAQAAVDFGHETARWLEEFVPHFKEIRVVGVPGNHPRATRKPQAKQAHNNGDWISYKVTEALLRDHPSIRFDFPRAAFATTMVCEKWRTLLLHGDGVRSTMPGVPWGGVVRRVTTLEQQFAKSGQPLSYVCLGHFHTANALDGVGVKTFLNGSVKGLDEFSLKQFGSGRPPSQVLLTFTKKFGVTGMQYLDLVDPEPSSLRVAA